MLSNIFSVSVVIWYKPYGESLLPGEPPSVKGAARRAGDFVEHDDVTMELIDAA